MEAKIRSYVEGLFAAAPLTLEVHEAREELTYNSLERYRDLLSRGFDEQEAYDIVIDSIGDIRELMEELSAPTYQTPPVTEREPDPEQESRREEPHKNTQRQGHPYYNEEYRQNTQQQGHPYHNEEYRNEQQQQTQSQDPWKEIGDNLSDVLRSVGSLVSETTREVFKSENWDMRGVIIGDTELVNRVVIPLDGCAALDLQYITASISLHYSEDHNLVIEEYMNRNDPAIFCYASRKGDTISVTNGHRTGQMMLRVKVKVYLPGDFHGAVSIHTQSGSIKSDAAWELAAFNAKSVSGSIKMQTIAAQHVQMRTTSGSIKAERLDGNIQAHSVSGSIKFEEVTGCGEFKTTSGGIRVEFDEVFGAVEATSISGGIRLELPENSGYEVNLSSVSGGIHTDFDKHLHYERRRRAHGVIGQPPFFPITVRTTSGGIHIND